MGVVEKTALVRVTGKAPLPVRLSWVTVGFMFWNVSGCWNDRIPETSVDARRTLSKTVAVPCRTSPTLSRRLLPVMVSVPGPVSDRRPWACTSLPSVTVWVALGLSCSASK